MNAVVRLLTDQIDVWTSAETEKRSGRGRGSMGSASVYGVKKLRELILELAVCGKLVPQDPQDESATELLKRIRIEKAKSGGKPSPAVFFHTFHKLPLGWHWVSFGEIAVHNSGKTLDQARNTGSLRPYITTSNLYWGRFLLEDLREMPIEDSDLERCTARQGDLLICEGGEAGRAAVWENETEICFQNHVHRARLFAGTSPYYLFRLFEKLNATGEINDFRKGVGISNMSSKSLASIPVPLPPLAEQHRIANKVEELMALCDQLEVGHTQATQAHDKLVNHILDALARSENAENFAANWQRITAHFDTLFTTETSIDALKRTVLQLAVMGKLVPQNPNDEPAYHLVKRIDLEKEILVNSGRLKSDKINSVDVASASNIPSGWAAVRMTNLCLQITDGTHQTPKYVSDGLPFLSAQNVKPFKFMPFDFKNVSQEEFDHIRKNRTPEMGDVLLTRVGAMIGEAAVIDVEFEFAFYVSLALLKMPKVEFLANFIALWLNSPLGTALSIENTLGRGVSAGNLNLSLIRNFQICLPPLAEQERILIKVDEVVALCDHLKARLTEANKLQQNLADALVERAVV